MATQILSEVFRGFRKLNVQESPLELQTFLREVFDHVKQCYDGPANRSAFEAVRSSLYGWGFVEVIEGPSADIIQAISSRIVQAGGELVQCAPSGTFADYAMQQAAAQGMGNQAQFIMVDCPGRAISSLSFVVALKAFDEDQWLASGSGLGVEDPEVFDLVRVFGRPDRSAMSDALGTILQLDAGKKCLIAKQVVKELEHGSLGKRWDSAEAGPYGVAIAFAAPDGLEHLLDFGSRHSGDKERREWVNRIIGEIFRRDSSKRLPAPLDSLAVSFLLESVSKASPEDSLAWSGVESLGEMGSTAKQALPALREILAKNRGMHPRVEAIYRQAISRIGQ